MNNCVQTTTPNRDIGRKSATFYPRPILIVYNLMDASVEELFSNGMR